MGHGSPVGVEVFAGDVGKEGGGDYHHPELSEGLGSALGALIGGPKETFRGPLDNGSFWIAWEIQKVV